MAFARIDHAGAKREDFAGAWSRYINAHPWDTKLQLVAERTFEITVHVREAAPATLSLAFSDWLAALRGSVDNGLYAFAASVSGQNSPPDAAKLQFPIVTNPTDFRKQARRLASLPSEFISKLECAQPYQSPYGIESNLLYWLHELARIDRHRALHVGLGRISEHRVQIGIPRGVTAEFDATVDPYEFIDSELVVARFSTSHSIYPSDIVYNPRVGIEAEIREWARFRLAGRKVRLSERMIMMELFMRNHVENMALAAGQRPPTR
jgi:hypothetical protein